MCIYFQRYSVSQLFQLVTKTKQHTCDMRSNAVAMLLNSPSKSDKLTK